MPQKTSLFEEKLSETISKPTELWKSFISLGMPTKQFNAIEENDTLSYDTRRESLRYYSSFMISDDFSLIDISEEKFLKIMTNIESFKAAGVGRLAGSF